MGAEKAESVILEDARNARQQMVVSAAERSHEARKRAQRDPVEPDLGERGAHQRADKDEVAASLGAGEPHDTPQLPERDPVAAIGRDRVRIGPMAERQQHDTPAAGFQ